MLYSNHAPGTNSLKGKKTRRKVLLSLKYFKICDKFMKLFILNHFSMIKITANCTVLYQKRIYRDFTIFVDGSSCTYFSIFWSYSLFSFLSSPMYFVSSHYALETPFNIKRKQRNEKQTQKRKSHELPYTELVKSGSFRTFSFENILFFYVLWSYFVWTWRQCNAF